MRSGKKIMRRDTRRRGMIVVYVAVFMTVAFGMAALAVDIGTLYAAQAELQRAADAAALAAATAIVESGTDDPSALVKETAQEYASLNTVQRHAVQLDTDADVELGKAAYDAATGRYTFQSTSGSNADSVRVTLRRTEGSASGPIQLMFAKLLGHDHRGLQARAAAVMIPRDISVIIDLSGSMCNDSRLMFYDRTDGGFANTRDVWAALNGPEPDRPYVVESETTSEYASDTGPTFGLMTTWGSVLNPASYNPASDTGLYYIKKSATTTDSNLAANLSVRGYSSSERSIILSGSSDSASTAHWKNRVCVLLGLCDWKSGKSGGKYPSGGDGDSLIEDSEMTNWVAYPSWRVGGWTWQDYAAWVVNDNAYKTDQTEFRYRYGLKTFTDYLMASYPQYSKNNNLWGTPEQPLRATKDAVQTMIDVISADDNLDHMSLEIFATTGRHEVNLTDNLQSIADRLYARQSGHYDTYTNIAGGMSQAKSELQSTRARGNASKVVVLMSDGVANTNENGGWEGDYSVLPRLEAIARANELADMGVTIYTVSVGYEVDRDLLQEIASIGHGQEFYASGNPEEYTEQLEDIFRTLGGKRPVALIE